MIDLFSVLTGREIAETLDVLEEEGVTPEDLEFLRDNPNHWGPVVAEAIKEGRLNWDKVVGTDPRKALEALQRIEDIQTLGKVYELSPLFEVWTAIMCILTSDHMIYDLIRRFNAPERRDAQIIGLRKILAKGDYIKVLEIDNRVFPPLRETHKKLCEFVLLQLAQEEHEDTT